MRYIVEIVFAATNYGRVISIEERLLIERKISNRIFVLTLSLVVLLGVLAYFFGLEAYLMWLVFGALLFASSLFEILAPHTKRDQWFTSFNGWSLIFLILSVLIPLINKIVSFFL